MSFSSDETSKEFLAEKEEEDERYLFPTSSAQSQLIMAATSDDNVIVEAADNEICHKDESAKTASINKAPMEGFSNECGVHETIATRIARLSNSARELTEETRDDELATVPVDESELGSSRQQSFDGPLLTPHMFNLPLYNDREGPETVQGLNVKSCEKNSSKTIRVFGKTVLGSPRAQDEILPPLFPSPKANRTEQHLDVESVLKVKEVAKAQSPICNIKEKSCALFPPPDISAHCADTKQARLAPIMPTPTPDMLTYLHVGGDVKRDQRSAYTQSLQAAKDHLSVQLSSSSHIDRETLLEPKQSEILAQAADAPSTKPMDPPGKRLTKRNNSGPADPPASAESIESMDTPKRNNRHTVAPIETLDTPTRNNHRNPKRMESRSPHPSLTPKRNNYVKSNRQHRSSPLRDVNSREPKTTAKTTECGSTPRKQSNTGGVSQPTSTAEKNVLLTIPSWFDDDINSPLNPTTSFGDSSIEKLIQQIDDIEADFGTIMASIPGSSSTLESMKIFSPKIKVQDQQDKKEVCSPIASVEIQQNSNEIHSSGTDHTNIKTQAGVSSANSFDSFASEDSVLKDISERIRHVHNEIEQMDSSDESDDDEAIIEGSDSQEEMLQLINRLNNAAESLRTFSGFQD